MLEIFDVFVGVVNILIGDYKDVVVIYVLYMDINVVWNFGDLVLIESIEVVFVGNLKCIWVLIFDIIKVEGKVFFE